MWSELVGPQGTDTLLDRPRERESIKEKEDIIRRSSSETCVVLGRWRNGAANPVVDVWIGLTEQPLKLLQLLFAHAVQVLDRECPCVRGWRRAN